MRIFLTGATGFIGSHVLHELLAAGHQVVGMTRSETGAASLIAAGAEAHLATLEDLDSICAGAAHVDAVVHTAFDHNFSNFAANCEKDRRVIGALGSVLKGSNRPLLITSGVGMGDPGDGSPAREDVINLDHPNPRIASELAGQALLDEGVNVSVVRLPQVHDTRKQGLITPYIEIARQKGAVAYVNEGANRWSAAHVRDVARLYALAIARGEPGARYNAVAEEGVSARAIADAVAAGLGLRTVSITPDQAQAQLGWFAIFAGLDLPASSHKTREVLDWQPSGTDLLSDLKAMDYAALAA